MKNPDEELLKQKYAELQMAASQIKQLQQQLEAVEEKKQELKTAEQSIDELRKTKDHAVMLAPVTDGIFVKAKLENADELIVNVGSNVCVRKTAEEAKGLLAAKTSELTDYQKSLISELTMLTEHANALENELGEMLKEQ